MGVCSECGQLSWRAKRILELELEAGVREAHIRELKTKIEDLERHWFTRLLETIQLSVSDRYKSIKVSLGKFVTYRIEKKKSRYRCEDCGLLKLNVRRRKIQHSQFPITQCDKCAEKAAYIFGFEYVK